MGCRNNYSYRSNCQTKVGDPGHGYYAWPEGSLRFVYLTLVFGRSWGFFKISGGYRPVLVSCIHGRFGSHNWGCLGRSQNRSAFRCRS